jgi:hypothetical protein
MSLSKPVKKIIKRIPYGQYRRLTNISNSKGVNISQSDIDNCKEPPKEDTFIGMDTSPSHDEYEQSMEGWCDTCSRAYQRHCDDQFGQLAIKHQVYVNKDDTDALRLLKAECNIPMNLKTMNREELLKLKDKMSDIISTSSNCRKIRSTHHNHCVRHKKTKIQGPDPGHQYTLDVLSEVTKVCNGRLNQVRSARKDMPDSYEREQMDRLRSRPSTKTKSLSLYLSRRKKKTKRRHKKTKKSKKNSRKYSKKRSRRL